jgi:hypothetical protein
MTSRLLPDANRLTQLPKIPLIARELHIILMLSPDTDQVHIDRIHGELVVIMVEHQEKTVVLFPGGVDVTSHESSSRVTKRK